MATSMHISEIASGDARIEEVAANRSLLARALDRCGLDGLLELTFSDADRETLVAQSPSLADRTVVVPRRRAARGNNTQLLVLGPRALLSLANFRSLRHAEWIA